MFFSDVGGKTTSKSVTKKKTRNATIAITIRVRINAFDVFFCFFFLSSFVLRCFFVAIAPEPALVTKHAPI
jgi:hypothetical protein